MKRTICIFLLGLLCGVAILQKDRIIRFFQKNETQKEIKQPISTPPITVSTIRPVSSSTPVPIVDPTATWKTYANTLMGFVMRYPENLKPDELTNDQVVFQLWGKTQRNDTEFYDGINISIEKRSLEGKKLSDVVNMYRAGSLEVWGEPVGEVTAMSLGGFSGFTYSVQGHEYYYVDTLDGSYIEILNLTGDPENIGYEQTAKNMISSFTKK